MLHFSSHSNHFSYFSLFIFVSLITTAAGPTMILTAQSGGIDDPQLIVEPAPLPLQPAGVTFIDPVFGTAIRRVSDFSDDGGFETQIYNQLQAFSSDNAYLLLVSNADYSVRRMADNSMVEGLETSAWNSPRWHPTRSHTLVHFDSNEDTTVRLQFTDLDSLITRTVYTFPAQYERIRPNQSFDEISQDGRWLGGMVSRDDGEEVIFALDIENFTLGAQVGISDLYTGPCVPDPEWGEVEPDWVGISPLGDYLVVQWVRDDTTRCSGLETLDLQTGDFIGRVSDHHHHGDLGVDTDGMTEFFMTTELSSPENPNLPAISMRLLPGLPTVSPPIYLQVVDWTDEDHISCQGPHGVGLISWGNYSGEYDWPFKNEIFLQYTDGSVLRLTHHRSSKCGYWVQPRASISRDGRYVIFASDWGEETGVMSCDKWSDPLGRGDPYIIDLQAVGIEKEKSRGAGRTPKTLDLIQNYPNPFNPSTTITFVITGSASRAQSVDLSIYDIRGRHVVTLISAILHPGIQRLVWNGSDSDGNPAASGIYFCTLSTGEGTLTRKMTLLK